MKKSRVLREKTVDSPLTFELFLLLTEFKGLHADIGFQASKTQNASSSSLHL